MIITVLRRCRSRGGRRFLNSLLFCDVLASLSQPFPE